MGHEKETLATFQLQTPLSRGDEPSLGPTAPIVTAVKSQLLPWSSASSAFGGYRNSLKQHPDTNCLFLFFIF